MKKILFFIAISISIFTPHLFAQTPKADIIILKGIILDKEASQPLAYVSVGILNKPIGTVSDSLGNFSFEISNENLSDTLQVSIVGYNSLQILVKDFISGPEKKIQLTEKVTQLEEVVITSGKPRENTEIIGRQGSGKLTQVSMHKTGVEETIGSEMGMLYKIEKHNAILKDLNFYISANNFNSIKFRINIYSVKNDLPDTLIYNKQIFTTLDKFKTGWTKIDLEQYHIKIKDEIIVTAQWIESTMKRAEKPVTLVPVAMSLFSKNCYVRVASQDKWKKVGMKLSNYITIAY